MKSLLASGHIASSSINKRLIEGLNENFGH